jgi:hypothetical protein
MLQARHRAGSTIAGGGGRRASFVTTTVVCVPPPPPPPRVNDASPASVSISIRIAADHSAWADSRVSDIVAPGAILVRKLRICATGVASASSSSSSVFAFSSRRSRSTGRLLMLRRPRCQRLADRKPLPSVASSASPASISAGANAASAHAEIEMQRLDAAPRRRQKRSDRIPCALAQPVLYALRASSSPPPPPSKPISPLMLFDFPVASHRRSTVSGPAPSQLSSLPPPPPPMKRIKSLWI